MQDLHPDCAAGNVYFLFFSPHTKNSLLLTNNKLVWFTSNHVCYSFIMNIPNEQERFLGGRSEQGGAAGSPPKHAPSQAHILTKKIHTHTHTSRKLHERHAFPKNNRNSDVSKDFLEPTSGFPDACDCLHRAIAPLALVRSAAPSDVNMRGQ